MLGFMWVNGPLCSGLVRDSGGAWRVDGVRDGRADMEIWIGGGGEGEEKQDKEQEEEENEDKEER